MEKMIDKKLGILGGMGPMATVSFMEKIINMTPAMNDQGHIPMIVSNVPQIPDRTDALLHHGTDPLFSMVSLLETLERAGATIFVIPCNTAHFWHERLKTKTNLPTISIIDSVVEEIFNRGLTSVGVLATDATIKTEMYQSRLESKGVKTVLPDSELQKIVMQGIKEVKANNMEESEKLLQKAFDILIENGAQAVIMGCTEIPIALARTAKEQPEKSLDSLDILAKACVNWYFENSEVEMDSSKIIA